MADLGVVPPLPPSQNRSQAPVESKGSLLGHVISALSSFIPVVFIYLAQKILASQQQEVKTPPPSLQGEVSSTIPATMQPMVERAQASCSTILTSLHTIVSAGSGVHGALFFKDRQQQSKGVFKEEEKRSFLDPLRQKGLLSTGVQDPLMVGEEAAYLISARLGFDLIPETSVVAVQGKTGSLQAFAEGYQLVGRKLVRARLDVKDPIPPITETEKTLFQKMACLDFLLGNSDRHSKNWMVQRDESGVITDVKLFDNGASFPRAHALQGNPGDIQRRKVCRNQYNWATYQIAESGFTDEMQHFIEGLLKKQLEEAFSVLDKAHPGYLTPDIKEFAFQRLALLKKAAGGEIKVQDGSKIRSFRPRDLFLFMDRRICDQALQKGRQILSWTMPVLTLFMENRKRNIEKKRQ